MKLPSIPIHPELPSAGARGPSIRTFADGPHCSVAAVLEGPDRAHDGPDSFLERSITRRRLLCLGGFAGASVTVGYLARPVKALGIAASSDPLDPVLAASYEALVESLGASPLSPVDAARAPAVARRLGERYQREGAAFRDNVDACLPVLDERGPGSFAALTPGRRLAQLRRRRHERHPLDGDLPAGFMLAQAVSLATAPFLHDPRSSAARSY